MAILEIMKPIERLLAPELKKLVLWYGVDDQGGKPLNKLEWEKIVAAGTTPPTFDEWTLEDEAKLESLKDLSTISMTDTSYGRLVSGKKKELLAAAGKMNENERAEMMSAWAKEDVLHDEGNEEEAQAELVGDEAEM